MIKPLIVQRSEVSFRDYLFTHVYNSSYCWESIHRTIRTPIDRSIRLSIRNSIQRSIDKEVDK